MEFEDRNHVEIKRMVDLILEIAANGLAWAREARSGTAGSGTRFCGMGAMG
jgi:hypothetical protein